MGAPVDVATAVRDELASSPRTWHLPQPAVTAADGPGDALGRGAPRHRRRRPRAGRPRRARRHRGRKPPAHRHDLQLSPTRASNWEQHRREAVDSYTQLDEGRQLLPRLAPPPSLRPGLAVVGRPTSTSPDSGGSGLDGRRRYDRPPHVRVTVRTVRGDLQSPPGQGPPDRGRRRRGPPRDPGRPARGRRQRHASPAASSTGCARPAVGAELSKALNPAEQVIKLVHDELVNTLGGETIRVTYASKPPTVVLLAGLQGSGKTTNAAKLARWFKAQGRQPLLVGADLQRPAAVEQLRTLGNQLERPRARRAQPRRPRRHRGRRHRQGAATPGATSSSSTPPAASPSTPR